MVSPANASNKLDIIVERRLVGDPISEIAHDLGISRQYIYKLFENLPREKKHMKFTEEIPLDIEKAVVIDYITAIPPASYIKTNGLEQFESSYVARLAEKYDLAPSAVKSILYKMTEHHPMIVKSPYYTELFKWRSKNAVSLSRLAGYAGCSIPDMRDILRGWKHLSLTAARGIKKHSGLTISEIYSDLIRLDRATQEAPHEQ